MSAGKHHKNKKRSPLRVLGSAIIFLVILAVISSAGLLFYAEEMSKPVNIADTEAVKISIPDGASAAQVAGILKENDLINSVWVFRFQSRWIGYDDRFRAGDFLFSRSMAMKDIMYDLTRRGTADTVRFTIPEGYTVKQTADKLAADGIADAAGFLNEVNSGSFDYRFLAGLSASDNRLEGFLYPETYDVYKDASPHEVADRMLRQFDSLFTEEYYGKAKEMGLTVLEVVTIASLIERETKVGDERALVSSVIHNRLEGGMRLQIDATVQYALGEQKPRLLYSDLEIDSPYNTYKIDGLPPGPICSPRIACIEAALYPADSDYLYYVLKPEMNGAHNFAADYGEFEKFKAQYIKALDGR
ncbi:MAG: endolytic transglycosylase MltG [Clostridiales Family XIII bacterium]|jgi:UPF0755 protein|nr:endolytic transglycosylase MltG [Clostridiales Family XIII bacterium]